MLKTVKDLNVPACHNTTDTNVLWWFAACHFHNCIYGLLYIGTTCGVFQSFVSTLRNRGFSSAGLAAFEWLQLVVWQHRCMLWLHQRIDNYMAYYVFYQTQLVNIVLR